MVMTMPATTTLVPVVTAMSATPAQVLQVIQSWEHWDTIARVAEKEYGVTPEEFAVLLPEYQKFIGLIVLGHRGIGMYSENVDKVWHSHILATTLYEQFCNSVNGQYIHHLPTLDRHNGSECTEPEDICTTKCSGNCKTPPPSCKEKASPEPVSFERFKALYVAAYGTALPAVWCSEADGIAA